MQRVDRQVTLLDHLLSLLAILCVCFVAGNSIGRPGITAFFLPIAIGSGVAGMVIGKLVRGRSLERLDWFLYFAVAVGVVFFMRQLNMVLPEDGFPFQIIAMSYLTWMLCLGQIVAWRDVTMAFQAVPCIASFGLVGAFDYPLTPPLFFGFLLCISSLFFRMHARQMLHRAELSFALSLEREEMADPQKLWERTMSTGAWRWMAGLGWALSSALLIVLLSFIGAPLIQKSVQAVAGKVNLRLPTTTAPSRPPGSGPRDNGDGNLRLGQGPNDQLGLPIFYAKCDETPYWHDRNYEIFTGSSWRTARTLDVDWRAIPTQEQIRARYSKHKIGLFVAVEADRGILSQFRHGPIPTPGTIYEMGPRQGGYLITPDLNVLPRAGTAKRYSGKALFSPRIPTTEPSVTPPEYNSSIDFQDRPEWSWLAKLSEEATKGAKTDFEKAKAIQRFISKRCDYNLKAERTPDGENPVEYFLNQSKQGYCDLFASSMALLARSAGLHARLTSGFLAQGETQDAQGMTLVTDKEAHVWCEIYFEGVGWQIFDATEGARDVTPDPSEEASRKSFLQNALIRGGLALFGLVAALGVWWSLRSERMAASQRTPKSRAGNLYRKFLQDVERATGKPCRLAETPLEYASRVSSHLSLGRVEVQALAARFTDLLYAPEPPTESALTELGQQRQACRKAMKRQTKN